MSAPARREPATASRARLTDTGFGLVLVLPSRTISWQAVSALVARYRGERRLERMRNKLEVVAERLSWGRVVAFGGLAVACLLGLAAWANEATRNFASCDPPQRVINVQPGHVYVCPSKYTHTWMVHTHAALVHGLLVGALVVAILAAAVGLALARRHPPVAGTI